MWPDPPGARATLSDLLAHRSASQGGELAFTYSHDGAGRDESVTYGELHRRALGLTHLVTRSTAPGDRVLLLLPPGLDYVAAMFACFLSGVVGVSAPPPQLRKSHLATERLAAVARDADASAVLSAAAIAPVLRPALSEGGKIWIVAEDATASDDESAVRPTSPGALAFLQYTSGSTGTPRGVMLSHANLTANLSAITSAFGLSGDSRGVSWLPPFHDMGLIGGLLAPVFAGFPMMLMSPVTVIKRPIRWLEAISLFQATVSGGPNFSYDLCVKRTTEAERAGLDLSSWRLAFNGAEPIRAETLDRFYRVFQAHGLDVKALYPCYGLAESTLLVSGGRRGENWRRVRVDATALGNGQLASAAPDERSTELVGCGGVTPGHQLHIVDPETHAELDGGAIGEVWLCGPSVAGGYWREPRETARVFEAEIAGRPGVVYARTGDLGGWVDGELVIVGRLKELLILNGKNHHPHDIETWAESASPFLRSHASAAFTETTSVGEGAVLVMEAGPEADDLDTVLDAVRREVATGCGISLTRIVITTAGAVPKTTSGKIRRGATRDMLRAGSFDVLAEWSQSP